MASAANRRGRKKTLGPKHCEYGEWHLASWALGGARAPKAGTVRGSGLKAFQSCSLTCTTNRHCHGHWHWHGHLLYWFDFSLVILEFDSKATAINSISSKPKASAPKYPHTLQTRIQTRGVSIHGPSKSPEDPERAPVAGSSVFDALALDEDGDLFARVLPLSPAGEWTVW